MNGKELLELYKEQIKSNPSLDDAFRIYCDFRFDDNISVDDDIFICGAESNYEIYPFAKDSIGGYYCLLDNNLVGYINSDGVCGIISKNVKDFFNLLATCKLLTYYFYEGVFESLQDFEENTIKLKTYLCLTSLLLIINLQQMFQFYTIFLNQQ